MTGHWTILDAAGEVVAACVAAEVAPDPAGYGGACVLALDGPIDPLLHSWNGTGWDIDLTAAREAAIARVNDAAEAVRRLYLTPGDGQAMTYLRKEQEARAWSAEADPARFPFLAAEAAATEMAIADLAATVIAQADAWATIGSAIEALRRGATRAIELAASVEAIAAAANVAWPA